MVSPITTSFIKDRPPAPTPTIKVYNIPTVEAIQEVLDEAANTPYPEVKFIDYQPIITYTTLSGTEVLRLEPLTILLKNYASAIKLS